MGQHLSKLWTNNMVNLFYDSHCMFPWKPRDFSFRRFFTTHACYRRHLEISRTLQSTCITRTLNMSQNACKHALKHSCSRSSSSTKAFCDISALLFRTCLLTYLLILNNNSPEKIIMSIDIKLLTLLYMKADSLFSLRWHVLIFITRTLL